VTSLHIMSGYMTSELVTRNLKWKIELVTWRVLRVTSSLITQHVNKCRPAIIITVLLSSLQTTCMLNHCWEWDKWVLTKFDHNRQWFNPFISPSHESAAVTVDCISRFSVPVRLILHYTTVDIHCRDRRYEWDAVIIMFRHVLQWLSHQMSVSVEQFACFII